MSTQAKVFEDFMAFLNHQRDISDTTSAQYMLALQEDFFDFLESLKRYVAQEPPTTANTTPASPMVPVQVMLASEYATVPRAQTEHAAGMDLHAAENAVVPAHSRVLVGTGLHIALPAGYEGQIRPRSGLALKHGLTVLNTPGTIDADYRGEVKVLLQNTTKNDAIVAVGDRIAQLVVAQVVSVSFHQTGMLPPSSRGSGGFGSTGA